MYSDIFTLLSGVVIMVATLIGAYYTTRWAATRLGAVSGGASGQKMALAYRMPLGRDQHLAVVKIVDRHVVIGCTPTQISFITELSEEESSHFTSGSGVGEENINSFAQLLERLKEKKDPSDDQDP